MTTWPHGKTAVIIGNPAHFALQRLAAFWRTQGLDVAIVTRRWEGPARLEDGTRIFGSYDAETPALRAQLESLSKYWQRVERDVTAWERRRYRRAMGLATLQEYHPSFANSLVRAVSIPPFVAQLDPAVVFGQEVFDYGLATALCPVHPTVLMPWGHDVFQSAETSSIAFAMVRRALHEVDLVMPGAQVGAERVVHRFGVPAKKVYVNSWGIERARFRRASEEQRRAFCGQQAIDPASIIILNHRRFRPGWGCHQATEAFLRLAEADARLQFFAIGGDIKSERWIAEARQRIAAKGLARRIRILDGHVPDATVQQLVSVADVFTSLVKTDDMGSFSVKEGIASGAMPVVSDVSSTREMERLGFRGFFVESLDASGVAAALQRAIAAPVALRAEIAAANLRYLEVYEDRERLLGQMLDVIAACPVPAEAGAPPSLENTLAVINEILAARKYLRLLPALLSVPRVCMRPLRRARAAWQAGLWARGDGRN